MSTEEGSPPSLPKARPANVDDVDTSRDVTSPLVVDGGAGSGDDIMVDSKTRSYSNYSNYSSDDSAFGGFGGGYSSGSSPTINESYEDDDIRFAKEMALAIAQNPNMTPDQLREMQQRTKQRVSGAPVSTTPTSVGKPMKAIRSSFKASMKAVSSVVVPASVAKVPNRQSTSTSSNRPLQSSAATSPVSPPGTGTTSSGLAGSPQVPLLPPNTPSRKANGNPKLPAKLGDFLDSQKEISISSGPSSTADCDRSTFSYGGSGVAAAAGPIRLTGIVWKRRSGLGKYSSSAAWERRRVVLQGSKLLYYKTLVDTKDEESNAGDDSEGVYGGGDDGEVAATTATAAVAMASSWLGMRNTPTGGNKESARGYLDLLKEQPSVSASYGHTGAPTPFAISIKVMSQTKWKLCFDTQDELMEWLAAMTDVVVQGSVDAYNAQILEAYDPRSVLGASGMIGQLSEPPKIGHAGTKTGAGGHRLWSTCHYLVKSENYPDENVLQDMIAEDELEDGGSDTEGEDVNGDRALNKGLDAVSTSEMTFAVDPSTGKDIWGIPADQVLPVVVLLNLALCLARASAVSVDMFWHLITFTNMALLGVISKEKVGGIITSKATVSEIQVRRLSSGLGLPPSSVTPKLKDAIPIAKTKAVAPDKGLTIPSPVTDFKPLAGSTGMRIENPTDLPVNKDGVIFAGWRTADPSIMQIRSMGYKKTKAKVASPGQLYKCVDVDIFESKTRFPDMASRVTLPKVEFNDKGPKTWNAPDLFVITIAIPTDTPKLYGPTENGGGYTISIYFAMEQDTRDILKRVTADGYNPADEKQLGDSNNSKVNAVRLLEEWCRRAPTDDAYMARFKVLPNAQNLKEIGLPSWIAKYNGKPFLIKRPGQTGFLYRHPEKSVVEFDISLHPFPYLAKQGICFMKDTYFKKVLVTFGFLIEGRADDELPECLIGLFQLCYPDPIHAIQGEDYFAGKSPSSKV